jgi:hypothetical protein
MGSLYLDYTSHQCFILISAIDIFLRAFRVNVIPVVCIPSIPCIFLARSRSLCPGFDLYTPLLSGLVYVVVCLSSYMRMSYVIKSYLSIPLL